MNKIIFYFNSNYVDIKRNNKLSHIISNSIKEGDIVNKELFIKDIKDKKIFSSILSSNVDIYLNHIIEEKDILYYKNIFEELNCNQINIQDTSKKLTSPTIINSDNIFILYYKNNFYKIIPELLDAYLNLFDIKDLKVISNTRLLDISGVRIYYYNYNNEYFLD